MKIKLKKILFWKFFNHEIKSFLGFFIVILLLGTVFYFLKTAKADNLSYTEDFTTTLFKDALQTSADWQGLGSISLHQEWIKADGSKSYIENVSNDGYASTYPLVFIDNRNQPYLAWESQAEILFTRGNLATLEWEKMDGTLGRDNVSNTLGSSNIDRVAVSSTGSPYIVWQDNTVGSDPIPENNYEILFSRWNGSQWVTMSGVPGYENLSNTPNHESKLPKIVLDRFDRPYIIWDDGILGGNNETYFTHWDGTKWATMAGTPGNENLSNNVGVSSLPRIALDANNKPLVTWQDDTLGNTEIFFTKWTTGAGAGVCGGPTDCWTNMAGLSLGTENVSNTAGSSTYDRLFDNNFALDSNKRPYIIWRDNSDGGYDVYFTHWDGSQWATMSGAAGSEIISDASLVSQRGQMVINSANNPQVVWLSNDAGTNKLYFSHWDGTKWAHLDGTAGYQVVSASTSSFPTLAKDSADNLYIAWLDDSDSNGKRNVFVTKSTGTSWTQMSGAPGFDNVSSVSWDNNRPAMVLAPNGNLYLAWESGNGTASEIWFSYWDAGVDSWRSLREGQEPNSEIVSNPVFSASGSRLAFDSLNNPYLLWVDNCITGMGFPLVACFTRWNATNNRWEDMAGNPGSEAPTDFNLTGSNVGYALMKLDSGDRPMLAWTANVSGSMDLFFSKWTNAGAIVCSGPTDCWTDMAGTTAGYENITNNALGETFVNPSSNSFALDSVGNPYFVWQQHTGGANSDILFTHWNPGTLAWETMAGAPGYENLSNNPVHSSRPQIILDSSDTPYVVWDDNATGNGDIYVTYWDGVKWAKLSDGTLGFDNISVNVGASGSQTIQFDSLGNPIIVWQDGTTGGGQIYMSKWNPGAGVLVCGGPAACWTNMAGTSAGYEIISNTNVSTSDFKTDAGGNAIVAWDSIVSGNREVYLTRWDAADVQWETMAGVAGFENISNNSGHSQDPSIFLDSFGQLSLVWADRTEASIIGLDYFYSRWDGVNWVNDRDEVGYTNITHNGVFTSTSKDVAMDVANDLHIFYTAQGAGGYVSPYYSRIGIPTNYARTAQSLELYGGGANVTSATLTSVSDNNGGPVTIKYFFSNDSGFTWQEATPGVPVVFNSNPTLKWRARLMTTNAAVNPTISGLTINYTTASSGGGGFAPNAPSDLACQAQDNSVIRWNFTDQANNETGFKLYNQQGMLFDQPGQDLTYIDETGLQTNMQYQDRQVVAYNGIGESQPSAPASCYTLANKPLAPVISGITTDSLVIKIDPNDGNPANTEYAIKELNTNKYLQADGSLGDTPVWQTWDNWGAAAGFKIASQAANTNVNINVNAQVSISLASNTSYSFAAKAKNGDGIETALSDPANATTQAAVVQTPQILATKGVAINLAKNQSHLVNNLIKTAKAQSGVVLQASGESNFVLVARSLGIFLALALIILALLLILGLQAATRHLAKGAKLSTKLKLAWHILSQEPAKVFSAYASKTENGTYSHAYEKHRSLHLFSQKNFKRLIGLAAIDLILLSYVALGLNHNGIAQTAPYDQSGLEVKVGDKLNYVIEIENQGTATANNVVVSDMLNNRLTFLSGSAKIKRNNQEITSGITINGNNLSFDLGAVTSNEIVDMLLTAQVKAGSEGQMITNVGQVSGDNFTSLSTNTTRNGVAQKVVVPPPPPPPSNTNVPPVVPPPPSNTNLPPAIGNVNIPPPPVTPPGGITQPPIVPPSVSLSRPNLVFGNETAQVIVQYLTSPEVKKVSQNIVTPILLAVVAINTIPTVIILTSYLLPYLNLLFVEPLLLFFRKKRKKWGIVYDSLTKLPIGLALVRLYNKKDNKLVQTKVTDREGRYLLIVNEPGKYYLSVTKPGYEYPTRYLQDEKQDTKFLDLYHGEPVEVKEQGVVVTANIPLDPQVKRAISASQAIRSYLLNNLRLIISYLGIILALIVVFIYPTSITIGSLVFHVLMFMLFRRLIIPAKPKSWGIVYDETNKQPLHYALVRIFDTKFNKLLETQVTDARGRYSFLVGKNQYQLLTEKQGFQPREIKPVDLINKETIVNLDVGLKKAS